MADSISKQVRVIEANVKAYATNQYPGMAGKMMLRFIDNNFRNQSWEGQAWKRRRNPKSKANLGRALLVKRGILRRSFRMQAMGPAVRVYTEVVYARVHNEGFTGVVNVSSHHRRIYGVFRVSSVKTHKASNLRTEASRGVVKEHPRNMRIPRRQFMPTMERQSPTLNSMVQRQITLDIMKILKYGR